MKPRVVLDTNVLVSALLSRGTPPARSLDVASSRCTLITSPNLIIELATILKRPKFDPYASGQVREAFIHRITQDSELVIPGTSVDECRDPKDNHLLSLALDSGADYLVSGDQDLLVLATFHGTGIVTPRNFVDSVERQTE